MMNSTHNSKAVLLLIISLVLFLTFIFNGIEARPTTTTSLSVPGRSLLQSSEPTRQSKDDTVRVDPLDKFKKYRGGFDITNKHYWSSTIFTGIYGYATAVLWLFIGLVYGGFLMISTFCSKRSNSKLKKRTTCHKDYYLWNILVATLFTVFAIVGSGLVLGGNVQFHSRAKTVVDIIIDTANGASETIYNTTGAMKNISSNLRASNGDAKASSFLTSTSQKLESQAADIQRQARKNRLSIDKGLKIVYAVTVAIISFNLVAVICLSVFGILRLRRALNVFLVLCWLLTVICWLFFGVYFVLEKFERDTCTALEDFQEDPYNNSLSSILPCKELLSAKSVLQDVSGGIYDLVNEINTNISTSYGNVIQVCNPFSAPPAYLYQPDNCATNTIKIGQISQVLRMISCPDSRDGTCQGGIYISPSDFRAVEGYTNSIQSLLSAYPGMENLVECQSVKDAFSEILQRHCQPLKKYTKMVWASMVFLAITMVSLVLIWIVEDHHERKNRFSDGSVRPHSVAIDDLMEAGLDKDGAKLTSEL